MILLWHLLDVSWFLSSFVKLNKQKLALCTFALNHITPCNMGFQAGQKMWRGKLLEILHGSVPCLMFWWQVFHHSCLAITLGLFNLLKSFSLIASKMNKIMLEYIC